MNVRIVAIGAGTCVWLVCALALRAQSPTTGQIVGTILDPSGAVVAGAQVKLTSQAGLERNTASDDTGHYGFPLLPPGTYRVEVNSAGFNACVIERVTVLITQTTTLNVPLAVAARQETVTVTAAPPLVEAESATRGNVIESDTLRQLPLPTRNFQQLLTLTAGTAGALPNSSELGRGDMIFNVNGQRSISNAVVVNGVDANSIGTGGTPNLVSPSTDSLQEFIVQTSLYDASQGRNVGGIVAAVTKSGTNAVHGNFYYFLRNDALNANNFFLNSARVDRPVYKRNQFGGTVGGPLAKDKLWYFVSYQGTRETNGTSLTNSLATVFVPNNLGDNRSDAAISALGTSFGVPVVNAAAKMLLQAKLPNGRYVVPSSPFPGSSTTAVPVPAPGISRFREDQFNTNLDTQLSNKNRLTAKFFWANNPTTQALYNSFGTGNALPLPGFGALTDFKQRLLSVSDTHAFSANLLNDARAGMSRITTLATPEEPFTSAQVGISSPLRSLFPGMPTISVANYFDIGASPFSDNDAAVTTYTFGDTLAWRKGKHSFKFGGELKYHVVDLRFEMYTRGELFHLGLSGNAFKDFLGGFFGLNGLSIMGSGVDTRYNRALDYAWFVNDDWRVHRRFTLSLGLRYDYYGPFTETQGRYVAIDPWQIQTKAVTGGVALTGGFVQAGNAKASLPGIPVLNRDSLAEPDRNNFGPRLGFAWQPLATNRFAVRGGYGIYYDRNNARLYNNQVLNFPYYTLAQVFTAPISNPFVQVPLPSAFPLAFNNAATYPFGGPPAVLPAAVTGGVTVVPANGIYPNIHNFHTPYIQQFNLGVQYEFVKNWLLDLGYVGSAGRKLLRLRSLNQGLTAGGNGPLSPGLSSLAAQGFGVHVMESSANSSYNSLQATLTKRFSAGLQFLLAYTYSHSLDDFSGDASGTSDNAVLPGDQVKLNNRASSDFDHRQRLVFSYVYDFPKFHKGNSRAAQALVNNWEIAGIVTLQSGVPFSVLTNATAFVQQRADFAPNCTAASATLSGSVNQRLNQYFKTSCFANASGVGQFGTTGRNILVGPDQRNVDFSIVKFFALKEQKKLEFRSEFFNLSNTPSFANPVIIRASGNFGQIVRTSTGPRVIQFALKFNF